MFYEAELTVPKDTPAYAPVTVTIEPGESIIDGGQIVFPKNSAGLVHVRLSDRGSIFMPAPGSASQWVTGDDETVAWGADYPLSGSPYQIIVEAYNEDDTWDRPVIVRLEVVHNTFEQILLSLVGAFRNLAESITALKGVSNA